MANSTPIFQKGQWRFLSAFKALGGECALDLVSVLSPLPPSLMVDLLTRASERSILTETKSGIFHLANKLPPQVEKKLSSFIKPDHCKLLLDRLATSEFSEIINPELKANLFTQAGMPHEASMLKYEVGSRAVREGLLSKAYENFLDFIGLSSGHKDNPEYASKFVSAALELSHLCFCTGKKLHETTELLKRAESIAEQKGDRRSLALIKMHLGRYVFNQDCMDEALNILESGLNEAKELGDDDILSIASEFYGAYYYHQGMYKDAIDYYEQALQKSELHEKRLIAFFLPHWVGLCAAYLGRFRQSIGILDCYTRRARENKEWALADNFKSTLGMVLMMTGRVQEASDLLDETLNSALKMHNHLGVYLSRIGLANIFHLNNRTKDAYSILKTSILDPDAADVLLRQYSYPWILELLFEFDHLNYEPIPGFGYLNERDRLLHGRNIHLRGVALRLHAREARFEGADIRLIMKRLQLSEEALMESGNPLELAKTWIEMARIKIREKAHDSARRLALKAWESFSGLNQKLFPDDLIPLLEGGDTRGRIRQPEQVAVDRFADILNKFTPSDTLEDFLQRILSATSKFFAAERGGIFTSTYKKGKRVLRLKVGINLTRDEVVTDDFHHNFATILKSFKKDKPVCISYGLALDEMKGNKVRTLLCIPFKVRGQVEGVLYHDNSFYEGASKDYTIRQLAVMGRQLGSCIERLSDYFQVAATPANKTILSEITSKSAARDDLIAESAAMHEILEMADRIAGSDANVLILGETGVGKELMARRLHAMSANSSGPFHTVDVGNIPETLIESILFGHEKGAFTGADQRKIGRLELAHQGTLFIDEVGNIPMSVQAKLLRALQEKSFVRVGGTRTIKSTFRILAATNVDLEQEVKNGRFRKDLFYRLNVVPILIPPLRERDEDIILLARHFLKAYSKRHNRTMPSISNAEESRLLKYHWPGNIRELKNLMERAVLLSYSQDGTLSIPLGQQAEYTNTFADLPTMEDMQRRYISYVIKKTGGKMSGPNGAAEILGMRRTTLYSRIKKLGIDTATN